VTALIGLRRDFDAFRRRTFLTGASVSPDGLKDVLWLAPEGREMSRDDWNDTERRSFGIQLGNDAPDRQRLLLLLNASEKPVDFTLSRDLPGGPWVEIFDTGRAEGLVFGGRTIQPGEIFPIEARSLVLLRHE
jgi:isoamylase